MSIKVSRLNFYFLSLWSLKAVEKFLSIVLSAELAAAPRRTAVERRLIIKIVILEAVKRRHKKVFRVYDNFNSIISYFTV